MATIYKKKNVDIHRQSQNSRVSTCLKREFWKILSYSALLRECTMTISSLIVQAFTLITLSGHVFDYM